MFSKKKIIVDEYFVNDDYLKKLYNMYIRQSSFERALEYLVFLAIIFTAVSLIMELFLDLSEEVLHFIHIFSLIILFIFILELLLEYSRSKTKKHFFKRYWFDFILVVFLSFYFLFAAYLGLARMEKLVRLKDFAEESKKIKISSKSIIEFSKTRLKLFTRE